MSDDFEAMVERAARAMERNAHPEWTDDQFEVWWTKDPFFTQARTSWGYFEGTRKEHRLHDARVALEAASGRGGMPDVMVPLTTVRSLMDVAIQAMERARDSFKYRLEGSAMGGTTRQRMEDLDYTIALLSRIDPVPSTRLRFLFPNTSNDSTASGSDYYLNRYPEEN